MYTSKTPGNAGIIRQLIVTARSGVREYHMAANQYSIIYGYSPVICCSCLCANKAEEIDYLMDIKPILHYYFSEITCLDFIHNETTIPSGADIIFCSSDTGTHPGYQLINACIKSEAYWKTFTMHIPGVKSIEL